MPTVAVINAAPETIELLQALLEDEGFTVSTAYIVNFKRDPGQLVAFFEAYHPQAVVYDIALPYEENWQFLHETVIPCCGLTPHQFVITTTNKAALERLVGPTPTFELVGKPFDLQDIVNAVHHALA